MEVGYGLEPVLTDLEAAAIAEAQAVPRFKSGDYDGGVLAAASALCAKLGGDAAPAAPYGAATEPRGLPAALWLVWLLPAALFPLFWLSFETGHEWQMGPINLSGRGEAQGMRYPLRFLFIVWQFIVFLFSLTLEIQSLLARTSVGGGGWSGGSGGGGGGFSGGGGSSGGGGASGSW